MGVLLDKRMWDKYILEDLASLYIGLIRIRRIYEEVRRDPEPYRSFFLGVIGGRSIGHSRRVMRTLRNLMGISVRGASEALNMISMGVPLERVIDKVSVSFVSGGSFLRISEASSLALENIFKSLSIDLKKILEPLGSTVERDLSALKSDPLYIYKILGGVAAACTRIMPLRSPHSLVIRALDGIPLGVFKRLFGDPVSISRASSGLVDPEVALDLGEDLSIITHKKGSPGSVVSMVIENTYQIHSMIRKTCRPYIRGDDERMLHLAVMTPESIEIARRLGIDTNIERILIRGARRITNPHPKIAMVRGAATIDLETCRAGIKGSIALGCRELLEYMGVKIALGIGRLEISEKSKRKAKIKWIFATSEDKIRESIA